jgi:hypothetical protein
MKNIIKLVKKKLKIDTRGYTSKELKLTEQEVLLVVWHWHDTMIPDIFQNEYGQDLSEVCESEIEDIERIININN